MKLESRKQINAIMKEMSLQNIAGDINNTFYMHINHRDKGLKIKGYDIVYTDLIELDSIYLAPSLLI